MPRASPDQPADSSSTAHSDSPPPPHDPAKPFCAQCHAFTLDRWTVNGRYKQRRFCDAHRAERMRGYVSGTPEKRAANYMRSMASKDRRKFGQHHTQMSRQDILSLLSPAQLENYAEWNMVPTDPTRILTIDNATIVKKPTRSFLLCEWRRNKDPVEYMKKLSALVTSIDV